MKWTHWLVVISCLFIFTPVWLSDGFQIGLLGLAKSDNMFAFQSLKLTWLVYALVAPCLIMARWRVLYDKQSSRSTFWWRTTVVHIACTTFNLVALRFI